MDFWTVFFIIYGLLTFSKFIFHMMRDGQEKIMAKVVEYRWESYSRRGNSTLIKYPYVKLPGKEELCKLKYGNNWFGTFKVGSEVPVFWNNDVLYYWHSQERGLSILIIPIWGFWRIFNKSK